MQVTVVKMQHKRVYCMTTKILCVKSTKICAFAVTGMHDKYHKHLNTCTQHMHYDK